MRGFDEVFNVLLEHSFRYFGPESEITKQIINNNSWRPSYEPNENNLINLVDVNLRENNDAYLNYLYIMDYYIFDHFHSKIKLEVNNPKNEAIQINNLDFSFDEEELRKVMGNIGHLLLKEPSLLNSSNYDYVNLYFQIKKLWSILITIRYMNENIDIKLIMNRIQKSFAIKQLQEIEKINVIIENYLKSFEEIFASNESINKHIKEFFEEFCLRYMKYITIGLGLFIKDFRHTISLKFTSIDLIKENLNNLNATDEFHQLLIDFLSTNNLQTESEMQQFLNSIQEKRDLLVDDESEHNLNVSDDLGDNFNVDENPNSEHESDNVDQATNEQQRIIQEIEANPNLNEISLNETSANVNNIEPTIINNNENIDNSNLINNERDEFDIGSLANISFGTISENTPKEDDPVVETSSNIQLIEPMNQAAINSQLEVNQIEDLYPIENQTPLTTIQSSIIANDQISTQKHNTEDPTIVTDTLPKSLLPLNPSESILNQSNSGSNLRNLVELTSLSVENDNQEDHLVDMNKINESINNFDDNQEIEDFTLTNIESNTRDSVSLITPDKSKDSDFDDLGLNIKVRETQRTSAAIISTFDFENIAETPITTKKAPKSASKIYSKAKSKNTPLLINSPKLNKLNLKSIPNEDGSTTEIDDNEDEIAAKISESIFKKVTEREKATKKRVLLETSSDEDYQIARRTIDKKKITRRSSVTTSSDELNQTINQSRKNTKRIESDSSSSESAKRLKGDIDTVDRTTRNRIVNDQPSIILKPMGQIQYDGELIPIYN